MAMLEPTMGIAKAEIVDSNVDHGDGRIPPRARMARAPTEIAMTKTGGDKEITFTLRLSTNHRVPIMMGSLWASHTGSW